MSSIPVIDISRMTAGNKSSSVQTVADEVRRACQIFGFFYVVGHGISVDLQTRLEALSRQFFALHRAEKMAMAMQHGGPAWRGYFPVGDELTSGQPDQKEGIYFGSELPDDHPRVKSRTFLHGKNLFPAIEGFRETVLAWIEHMTQLGHALLRAIAVSLKLTPNYFEDRYTHDPLVLFRIFHYPPLGNQRNQLWSVGEHTDYGLLTILKQDQTGGLQIKSQSAWIDAPVIDNAFICNLGDMLDRMTGGAYRSTPHRVRNTSANGRLSFPFFFDPNWDASVGPIDSQVIAKDDSRQRWDGSSVHDWNGTYGQYILKKISHVFPKLKPQ
jgi:isopenicillin N synthase-like dioxygenase